MRRSATNGSGDPSDADRLRILDEAPPLLEQQIALVCARQKTLAQFARELRRRLHEVAALRAELNAKPAGEAEPPAWIACVAHATLRGACRPEHPTDARGAIEQPVKRGRSRSRMPVNNSSHRCVVVATA